MRQENEIWKPIINFEDCYEVSSWGRIRNIRSGRMLKPSFESQKGSPHVTLSLKNKRHEVYINRVVATHFIPNPNNFNYIHLIDGDYTHNFVQNLEWRRTPPTIFDESISLNLTKHFAYQIRREQQKLCIICGAPQDPNSHRFCPQHFQSQSI